MINTITLKIGGLLVDTAASADFEFRLNRMVADLSNFQVRGGDYSTTLDIPNSKKNLRILGVSGSHFAVNKFRRATNYQFSLEIGGVQLLTGTLLITYLTTKVIGVELNGISIDWVSQLEDINLNKLGYVNGYPTWFGGNRLGQVFEGGKTISVVNELGNRQTDYICPIVVRYNTPLADYLSNSIDDIFGQYDGSGNQVLSPLDFPDSWRAVRAFFGTRLGLTFQDLPPALYLRNLVEKIFSEIGYNVACSLFQEAWFNQLYVTYTGDGYKYNWATLAQLLVKYASARGIVAAHPSINTLPESIIYTNQTLPVSMVSVMLSVNLAHGDDATQRIDRVTNFNKYLSGDINHQYIAPAAGKYRIKIISQQDKILNGSEAQLAAWIDTWGGATAGDETGWGETAYIILRKNQAGETVLREDPINDVIAYMNGDFPDFPSTSSDIVAYFFPKRAQFVSSTTSPDVVGSPLTDFQTIPQVNSYLYTETPSAGQRRGFSSVNMEIEVDLLENERIEFHAVSLAQFIVGSSAQINNVDFQINGTAQEIRVEYLCDFDDISLADNLPDISAKDFIRGFVNQFNLNWIVDGQTVRFLTESEFYQRVNPLDITSMVDDGSQKMLPIPTPIEVTVGYDNDPEDAELNQVVSQCVSDLVLPTNYANKVIDNSGNIYAKDKLDATSKFSATRFIEGDFSDCTDVLNSFSVTEQTVIDPVTGLTFRTGMTFLTNKNFAMFRLPVPTVQTADSIRETLVGNLNYNYNQSIRILQFLGTAGELFYTNAARNEDYRFKIDSPDLPRALDLDFWIRPTVSSFALEQPYYPVYSVPANTTTPTQTMRYDVSGGLYDKFFINTLEMYNGASYVLTAKVFLTPAAWNSLQGSRLVVYQEVLYRLLEIQDYDPTGRNPATIKLIKI